MSFLLCAEILADEYLNIGLSVAYRSSNIALLALEEFHQCRNENLSIFYFGTQVPCDEFTKILKDSSYHCNHNSIDRFVIINDWTSSIAMHSCSQSGLNFRLDQRIVVGFGNSELYVDSLWSKYVLSNDRYMKLSFDLFETPQKLTCLELNRAVAGYGSNYPLVLSNMIDSSLSQPTSANVMLDYCGSKPLTAVYWSSPQYFNDISTTSYCTVSAVQNNPRTTGEDIRKIYCLEHVLQLSQKQPQDPVIYLSRLGSRGDEVAFAYAELLAVLAAFQNLEIRGMEVHSLSRRKTMQETAQIEMLLSSRVYSCNRHILRDGAGAVADSNFIISLQTSIELLFALKSRGSVQRSVVDHLLNYHLACLLDSSAEAFQDFPLFSVEFDYHLLEVLSSVMESGGDHRCAGSDEDEERMICRPEVRRSLRSTIERYVEGATVSSSTGLTARAEYVRNMRLAVLNRIASLVQQWSDGPEVSQPKQLSPHCVAQLQNFSVVYTGVSMSTLETESEVARYRKKKGGRTAVESADVPPNAADECPQKPIIGVVCDGEVFVLVFVPRVYHAVAEAMIDEWKKGCQLVVCHLILRYLIFPVDDEVEGGAVASWDQCQGIASEAETEECVLQALRSSNTVPLRNVLLQTLDVMNRVATTRDVIVLLNGLDGMFSFPQPMGAVDSSRGGIMRGIVPLVEYGEKKYFRLQSNIVVAEEVQQQQLQQGGEEERTGGSTATWSSNAILGTTKHLLPLLEAVQADKRYSFADDAALRRLLITHLHARSSDTTTLNREDFAFSSKQREAYLRAMSRFIVRGIGNAAPSAARNVTRHWLEQMQSPSHQSFLYEIPARLKLFAEELLRHPVDSEVLATAYGDYLVEYRVDVSRLPKVELAVLHDGGAAAYVYYPSYMAVMQYLGSTLTNDGRWVAVLVHLIKITQQTHVAADFRKYLFTVFYKLVEIGKYSRTVSQRTTVQEFKLVLRLLTFFQQEYGASLACTVDNKTASRLFDVPPLFTPSTEPSGVRCIDAFPEVFLPFRIAMQAVTQEIGDYHSLAEHAAWSFSPATYDEVSYRLAQWTPVDAGRAASTDQQQAVALPRVHIVTYGSEFNEYMQYLAFSAHISGVDLEMLGIGDRYTDYSNKLHAYIKYLLEPRDPPLQEEDYVMFVDGYDVLLFPHITNLPRILQEFHTPIVFCAENGIYPEFATSFFYARGGQNSTMGARFMNSGCMVGRVAQMRHMYRYAQRLNDYIRDDQQVFVRYAVEHPDMVSIDADNKLFLTTYKLSVHNELKNIFSAYVGYETLPSPAPLQFQEEFLALSYQGRSISVLHCNNAKSNELYNIYVAKMIGAYYKYFAGPDGAALLAAGVKIRNHEFNQARKLLASPEVASNRTANGGKNELGDYLEYYLGVAEKEQGREAAN